MLFDQPVMIMYHFVIKTAIYLEERVFSFKKLLTKCSTYFISKKITSTFFEYFLFTLKKLHMYLFCIFYLYFILKKKLVLHKFLLYLFVHKQQFLNLLFYVCYEVG